MINISKISLSFGKRQLFDELTVNIQEFDRIGLVGRNGYGKSTLLKVIAGQQKLDGGKVSIIGQKRIAYLNQELVVSSELAVLDFVVQESMKDSVLMHEPEALVRARADKILRGLGFTQTMLETPLNTLSGGWKMRVVLAHLLVLQADFYLFDEPTNHLDIVAKDWFLQFLKSTNFGFLLVCHEKAFLNELCTEILALDTPAGKMYEGNYDQYVLAVQENRALLEAASVQQQKMIKQKKETIAKFRAGTRASQAQSMMKELENLELIELPDDLSTMHITMPEIKPSGLQVLTVKNLSGGYIKENTAAAHPELVEGSLVKAPNKIQIFSNINLSIERGEKIAIIAADGVGKTTLLHTIAGVLPKFSGTIDFGYNVQSAVFYQEQTQVLNLKSTIWEEVCKTHTKLTDAAIRAMLGSFLFRGDDIQKKIGVLSGGEKSRVGMIKVLVQQANFLLLDEPTNHLDIPSKEILLKTLQKFPGTLLFVSHDHDFINHLATAVIELTPNGAYRYPGNYDDYKTQKKFAESEQQVAPVRHSFNDGGKPEGSMSGNKIEDQKKLKKLENAIEKLAKEQARLTKELESLDYGTPEFTTRYNRLTQIKQEEAELFTEWEALNN